MVPTSFQTASNIKEKPSSLLETRRLEVTRTLLPEAPVQKSLSLIHVRDLPIAICHMHGAYLGLNECIRPRAPLPAHMRDEGLAGFLD